MIIDHRGDYVARSIEMYVQDVASITRRPDEVMILRNYHVTLSYRWTGARFELKHVVVKGRHVVDNSGSGTRTFALVCPFVETTGTPEDPVERRWLQKDTPDWVKQLGAMYADPDHPKEA